MDTGVYSTTFIIGLILLSIWSMIWKGLALWKAARREDKTWYVVMLILNTAGILEIIYYFFVGKSDKACCESENK
jgi:hypothetical protein